MKYSAPQIAGRDEPFRSAIREHLEGYRIWRSRCWRASSRCDIEDAFRDENGPLLLSKTTVRPRRCTKSKSCASRLFTTLAYDPMHGRPRVLLADDRLAVVTPSVSQTGIGHAKSFPPVWSWTCENSAAEGEKE
jgi:hypothetical protein